MIDHKLRKFLGIFEWKKELSMKAEGLLGKNDSQINKLTYKYDCLQNDFNMLKRKFDILVKSLNLEYAILFTENKKEEFFKRIEVKNGKN